MEWLTGFFEFDIWGFYRDVFVAAAGLLSVLGLDPRHPLSWLLLLLVLVWGLRFLLRPRKPGASGGWLFLWWMALEERKAQPFRYRWQRWLFVIGALLLRGWVRPSQRPLNLAAVLFSGLLCWWGLSWWLTPPPAMPQAAWWGAGLLVMGLLLGWREMLRFGVHVFWLLGFVGVIVLLAAVISGNVGWFR